MDIKSFLKNISFTRNETKVIIFIAAVLVTGFSIKYYKYLNADDKPYDFTETDSEFMKRSMLIYSKEKDTIDDLTQEEKELIEKIKSSESQGDEETSYFKQRNKIELTEKSININTATKEELMHFRESERQLQKELLYLDSKILRAFVKLRI